MMHSIKLIVSRGSSGSFGHHLPTLAISQLHTTESRFKFLTDTELVHQGVQYGRSAYPSRPNDPRVPSNPNFGITYLHKPQIADQPSGASTSELKRSAKKESISKAMKIYLERAKKHNEFMKTQEDEFDMGRRHLANMMGINEATMSQNDINVSECKYLLV